MTELLCPKCHGALRPTERSGVIIDRCTRCRGIFLDRGELEGLIETEGALLYGKGVRGQGISSLHGEIYRRTRRGKRRIPVTERVLRSSREPSVDNSAQA